MGRYITISWFFALILLLHSCAQVGQIEGGKKDTSAPRPIKFSPDNESIHFDKNKISITFDEYFSLNNPIENIQISPENIKLHSKIDKRKLILDLEGDLLPNTTYQLMLNNAVKDIHEGNDTLIHYVFSTGNYIDSIRYSGKVIDAYEGIPVSQYVVGLYELTDSIEKIRPRYYTKTDKNGKFQLKYLKNGAYKIIAFQDFNNDLKYQTSERVAFKENSVQISKSFNDSLSPLLAFKNEQALRFTTKSFHSPRLVKIAANSTLKHTQFYQNQQLIDTSSFFYYSTDSVAILLPTTPTTDFYLTAKTANQMDTIQFSLPIGNQPKKSFVEAFPKSKDISHSKSIMLLFPDEIQDLNEDKVKTILVDSVYLPQKITLAKNIVSIDFPDTLAHPINIELDKGAIQFKSGSENDKTGFNFTCKPDREFGAIVLKPLKLNAPYLVEFIINGKVAHTITSKSLKDAAKVNYLIPGEYTFRLILDANNNGKWDTGNISEKRQAEQTFHFNEKTVVRANWETEVELEITQ